MLRKVLGCALAGLGLAGGIVSWVAAVQLSPAHKVINISILHTITGKYAIWVAASIVGGLLLVVAGLALAFLDRGE